MVYKIYKFYKKNFKKIVKLGAKKPQVLFEIFLNFFIESKYFLKYLKKHQLKQGQIEFLYNY